MIGNSSLHVLFNLFLFFAFFLHFFFAFSGDRKCQDFGGCVYVVCIRDVSVCARCLHALFVYVCVVSDWEFEFV